MSAYRAPGVFAVHIIPNGYAVVLPAMYVTMARHKWSEAFPLFVFFPHSFNSSVSFFFEEVKPSPMQFEGTGFYLGRS